MNNEQLQRERQHYFDMGIIEGKRSFRMMDFVYGLAIGFAIGILLLTVFK